MTAMSFGASARARASSAGISATQGTHQVAQRLITMPCPRNSASWCGVPFLSTNVIAAGATGGLVGCSTVARFGRRSAAKGLRAGSPNARVPPARPVATTRRREINMPRYPCLERRQN